MPEATRIHVGWKVSIYNRSLENTEEPAELSESLRRRLLVNEGRLEDAVSLSLAFVVSES